MTWDYKLKPPLQAGGTTCNVLGKISLYSLTVFLSYAVLATLSSSAKAQDQITADAERGRALFATELRSIYENRTWP
jgi:hypothetical protein